MLIVPAIDIIKGQCVRLTQGEYKTSRAYGLMPEIQAQSFVSAGAQRIHVIDLEGAKAAHPVNHGQIINLKRAIGNTAAVEVGGGIRDLHTASMYLRAGIDRLVIGTSAVHDPGFLKKLIDKFGPERVIAGLDINKDGHIATHGWLEESGQDTDKALAALIALGVTEIIVTDISRDGTMTHPNFELYRALKKSGLRVCASGGVSEIADLQQLQEIGLCGAIVGKALYENRFELVQAIEVLQGYPVLDSPLLRPAEPIVPAAIPSSETQILHGINWKKMGGLVPAVIQDVRSGEILMLAYMTPEALELTVSTRLVHFFSRSRNRIWMKGEGSGNYLRLANVSTDCDRDTLLIQVEPIGQTCQTGDASCFRTGQVKTEFSPADRPDAILHELFSVIQRRRRDMPDGSKTAKLLQAGKEFIVGKIAEEALEVMNAAKREGKARLTAESCDLLYHLLVLLTMEGVSLTDVVKELRARRH